MLESWSFTFPTLSTWDTTLLAQGSFGATRKVTRADLAILVSWVTRSTTVAASGGNILALIGCDMGMKWGYVAGFRDS